MPKQVTFSVHALEQLRERGLSEETVIAAVQKPDQVIKMNDRRVAQKRFHQAGKEYLLRAVYEEQAQRITIVTVYQTSKVSRYWRQE